MSDKPSIPAWQRVSTSSTPADEQKATSETTPEEQEDASSTSAAGDLTPTESDEDDSSVSDTGNLTPTESEDGTSSATLLDQASRFLKDDAIRDAPWEKKVAFLQSKGVAQEDIEALLGNSEEVVASPAAEEISDRAWPTAPPKPVETPAPAPPQPREIPPIVTYPEFLASTEKPPPLMTTKRLLNTAYVTGGVMSTIYGLSKYIIAPMTQNLAESRLDFAAHTQEQLKEFNKKLEDMVSVDPAHKTTTGITDAADDDSDSDSDPTELYHRDYGTQTTPSLSRRPSISLSKDAEPTVTAHENRLKKISAHLRDMTSNSATHRVSSDALKTKVSDLTTYLGEMSYQNQYYSSPSFYGSSFSLPGSKDGKSDQIEILKGDIRAVKGVFLSARNFPVGAKNGSPMPTGRVGA